MISQKVAPQVCEWHLYTIYSNLGVSISVLFGCGLCLFLATFRKLSHFININVSLFTISLQYLYYCVGYERKPGCEWDTQYLRLNKWIVALVSHAKKVCCIVLYHLLKLLQDVSGQPVCQNIRHYNTKLKTKSISILLSYNFRFISLEIDILQYFLYRCIYICTMQILTSQESRNTEPN